MGIYDRDWYKNEAKKRFRTNQGFKTQRENKVRSAFEQYTKSFSRTAMPRSASRSYVTSVLVWLGLGTLCFALISWGSTPKVLVSGNRVEVIIPMAQDGHHYIDGVLNGKSIRFLVDTGASYVSIGSDLAAKLGMFTGKPTKFETANGSVLGQLFENQTIQIGGLNMPPLTVGVMPNSPNSALLGQNFLRHVEMVQVDKKLILRGQHSGLGVGVPQNATAKKAMYAGFCLLFLAWLSSFMFQGSRVIR